jgi:GT2 family glycosyltransferase
MADSAPIQLSVIIVNYNVKYFLEQALRSVRKASKNLTVEVFVVDNNSVDDSVEMVRQTFPEVHLIKNTENLGFSKANNQAIRQAKGTYILLLNPDTVVEEDTFEKCLAFMESRPEAGGLGVKMIDGSGKFLPESKRGFPTPFVAFCKTFGLARLFPKSKLFNRYHLGFLDKNENHPVDVLSGAFMWMRKSVLDEIGLLDEQFFMYGEDIDLSYRIKKAGYQNYYLADTTIIHYKGESTKKGSLNYVKVFYNAMIIFAQKHFKGEGATLFVGMLKAAIYFRAGITLFNNLVKKWHLPVLEGLAIFGGLLFIKDFWATYHFKDPDYYNENFLYFNAPLYTLIWLAGIYLTGAYQTTGQLRRLFRGIFIGTLLLASVYGFLDLQYRSSRAIILLGALWTLVVTLVIRSLIHFIRFRNFKLGRPSTNNLIIIGTQEESKRVLGLLHRAQVFKNFIGTVAPNASPNKKDYLSHLSQLDEVVRIYRINEIIFCSKDIPAHEIIHWMSQLGAQISYRIVPEESWSIIGSHSKNTSGELYTIDIQFNISDPLTRRNKRWLDVFFSLFLILTFPIQLFLIKNPLRVFKNALSCLLGKKSWVGYQPTESPSLDLPNIKPGILTPLDGSTIKELTDEATINRLNLLYAKDYDWYKDVEVIWKGYTKIGSR